MVIISEENNKKVPRGNNIEYFKRKASFLRRFKKRGKLIDEELLSALEEKIRKLGKGIRDLPQFPDPDPTGQTGPTFTPVPPKKIFSPGSKECRFPEDTLCKAAEEYLLAHGERIAPTDAEKGCVIAYNLRNLEETMQDTTVLTAGAVWNFRKKKGGSARVVLSPDTSDFYFTRNTAGEDLVITHTKKGEDHIQILETSDNIFGISSGPIYDVVSEEFRRKRDLIERAGRLMVSFMEGGKIHPENIEPGMVICYGLKLSNDERHVNATISEVTRMVPTQGGEKFYVFFGHQSRIKFLPHGPTEMRYKEKNNRGLAVQVDIMADDIIYHLANVGLTEYGSIKDWE